MSGDEMLQLRFHFGERDRDGDGPLEAAVMDACARRGAEAAVTLRGVEGFGAKHQLRTDRLLSLSEDSPLVVAAVGEAERIEGLAEELGAMASEGLLVLERVTRWRGRGARSGERRDPAANLSSGTHAPASEPAGRSVPGEPRVKATVWGPRGGPASPHFAAVEALRRHGADAATVLLGVDGVLGGERRRARFSAGNRGVPVVTVTTGPRAAIDAALADLDPAPPLVTFEPVDSYSRQEGATLHGEAVRVTLVTSEIATSDGRPRYLALIHALREEGAAGATALRGVWGFRGDREPHGDRVLALRRDVPLLLETVDVPERAERWYELANSLAGADDVVDSQAIPRMITLDRVQAG